MTDASDQITTTLYPYETLEVRGTVLDSGESTLTSANEVPYLVAHGVRLARLHYEQPSIGEPRVGGKALHVLFELGDHLGSTSVVLEKETSELVEASTYQGYGAKESDYRPGRWKGFREDYGFTGKEDDSEFGIVYFGKRFYSPGLNRWLTADPLAVHLPGKADLNLYAYVRGGVLRVVDKFGLDSTVYSNDLGTTTTVTTAAGGSGTTIGEVTIEVEVPRAGSAPAPQDGGYGGGHGTEESYSTGGTGPQPPPPDPPDPAEHMCGGSNCGDRGGAPLKLTVELAVPAGQMFRSVTAPKALTGLVVLSDEKKIHDLMNGSLENGASIHYSKTATAIGDDAATLSNFEKSKGAGGYHDLILHSELDRDTVNVVDDVVDLSNAQAYFNPTGLRTSAEQVVSALESNPNFLKGTPIRLVSCAGDCGLAQQIRELLGVEVEASKLQVRLNQAGELETHEW